MPNSASENVKSTLSPKLCATDNVKLAEVASWLPTALTVVPSVTPVPETKSPTAIEFVTAPDLLSTFNDVELLVAPLTFAVATTKEDVWLSKEKGWIAKVTSANWDTVVGLSPIKVSDKVVGFEATTLYLNTLVFEDSS